MSVLLNMSNKSKMCERSRWLINYCTHLQDELVRLTMQYGSATNSSRLWLFYAISPHFTAAAIAIFVYKEVLLIATNLAYIYNLSKLICCFAYCIELNSIILGFPICVKNKLLIGLVKLLYYYLFEKDNFSITRHCESKHNKLFTTAFIFHLYKNQA